MHVLVFCRLKAAQRQTAVSRGEAIKRTLVLLASILLSACRSAAPAVHNRPQSELTSEAAPTEFLLESVAKDFHEHRPSQVSRFRNVRAGYVLQRDGTRQYMLCGAFTASDNGEAQWTPFVTIKTSEYKQWLGPQAEALCGRASIVWLGEDLSSSLQSRLHATQ